MMVVSIAPLVMLLLVEILVFGFAAVFAEAVAGAFKFAADLVTSASLLLLQLKTKAALESKAAVTVVMI